MTHDFWSDLMFTWRRARRRPLVPLVTVLTMAVSIAAVTAVFGVADAVLFRPLPLPDSNRIARFHTTFNGPEGYVPAINYFDLRDIADASDALAYVSPYQTGSATWRSDAGPQPLSLVYTGPEFADVIGLPLLHGRRFAPEEFSAGAARVAIVSHAFWQRAFGGDTGALGHQLDLDGQFVTIVGVLPDAPFLYPAGRDLWLPLTIEPDSYLNGRQSVALAALARIAPDRDLDAALVELETIDRRLRQAYPDTSGQRGVTLRRLIDDVAAPVRPTLVLLGVAVLAVLLIAAANIADLLLGDAMTRQREFALRAAIGGAASRLTRQVLVEGLCLAVAGGALGLLLAPPMMATLIALYPSPLPRMTEIGVDLRVFSVALGAAVFTGLLAATPLIRAARRRNLLDALQVSSRATGARRTRRLASSLVAIQVGATVVLLFAASLFLRGFVETARVDVGFDTRHTLTFRILPSGDRYESPAAVNRLYDELSSRLAALPGIDAAGVTGFMPLMPGMWGDDFARVGSDDRAPNLPSMSVHFMTPDLPRALGLPVLEGRPFTDRDTDGAPLVVIVNETLARRYLDADAVGREIVWMDEVRRVVGVVGDKRHAGLHEAPGPELYVPFAQYPRSPGWVVIRAAQGTDPGAAFPVAEATLRELDPNLPATRATTLDALVAVERAPERFRASLAAALGVVSAALAGLGLYGVLTHLVTARRRELGVRMALGATASRVQRSVVFHALRLIGAGGILGTMAAAASADWLRGFLPPGGAVSDPVAILAAVASLMVVALLSAWLPARRASRVDPLSALRAD